MQKSRKLSLESVRRPQKVSMCNLKVIPIHFLEPKIGPKNQKFTKTVKMNLPTPKIPSITRGLLGIPREMKAPVISDVRLSERMIERASDRAS